MSPDLGLGTEPAPKLTESYKPFSLRWRRSLAGYNGRPGANVRIVAELMNFVSRAVKKLFTMAYMLRREQEHLREYAVTQLLLYRDRSGSVAHRISLDGVQTPGAYAKRLNARGPRLVPNEQIFSIRIYRQEARMSLGAKR